MKKSELFFSVTQVFVDLTVIFLAGLVAFKLRNTGSVQQFIQKEGLYDISFESFALIALIASVGVVTIFAFEGLYKTRVTRRIGVEALKILRGTTIALVIIILGFFLQREWFSSRFIIVAAWFLTIVFVIIAHVIMRAIQKYALVTRGVGQHRVLVVGSGEKITFFCRTIQLNPTLGYRVVKHIETADLKRVKKIHKRFGVDEVIVNEQEIQEASLKKLYDFCEINAITYKIIPTARQTTQFEMTLFNGEPLIVLTHTPLDGWGCIIKRMFDLIGSVALIIATSPFMAIAAILIKLEDPSGPIIFKNTRIGTDGKEFGVYKFRYMKWEWCTTKKNPNWQAALAYEEELIATQSVRQGPIYKIKDDPRKLRIGKILERLSIDEFPQFFNVLGGSMSLVGPRPHQEREVDEYREYHRRLLTISPGITGMAQVSGRSDLDFEDEYRLDVYYIENWSLWLDVVIILKTVPAVLASRKN